MKSRSTQLHNTIMRRIYYAYAIALATNPVILHGFAMLGILIGLTYFVSLGNVLQNIMNVEVGQVGAYLYHSVLTTEITTLVLAGCFILALLSLRITLKTPQLFQKTHQRA